MTIQSEEFEIIFSEAKAHFDTGRFVDAAKTFEHLSSICAQNDNLEDMLYFIYRAAVSWSIGGQEKEMIRLYQRMGLISIKYSTKLAYEKLENSTNLIEKIDLMNIIQSNLFNLNEDDKRKNILSEQIKLFQELIQIIEDFDEKKELINKLLSIAHELRYDSLKTEYTMILAKITEKEGDYQLKNADFDPDLVALRHYHQAIEIYSEIKNVKRINKIKKKISKIEVKSNN